MTAFRIVRDGGVAHLVGSLDVSAAGPLAEAAADMIDEAGATLVLDLAGVATLDSHGMAAIMRLHATARGRGTSVVLRNASQRVRRALLLSGADQVFEVETTSRPPRMLPRAVPVERTGPPPRRGSAAVPQRAGRGFVSSFGDDRACEVQGCTTTLSRYNPTGVCAHHDGLDER